MTSAQQFVADVGAPVACKECRHLIENGHFGLRRGTHHIACHRTYSAGVHCTRCCTHFHSDSAFNAHIHYGKCRDLAPLKFKCGAAKFAVKDGVWWGTRHESVCKNWTACGFRKSA